MTRAMFSRRRLLKTAYCSSAALALNLRPATADPPAVAPEALHLLSIGDFGTTGKLQHAVAEAMTGFLQRSGLPPTATSGRVRRQPPSGPGSRTCSTVRGRR